MAISWIKHEGVKVLYTDCRKKSPRQLKELFLEYTELFKSLEEQTLYRVINFHKVPVSAEMVNEAKAIGKHVFSKKSGITVFIGITGIKRFYTSIYCLYAGYDIVFKNNLGDALKYIDQRRSSNLKKEVPVAS